MEYLDFELPIKELEDQLDKCQIIGQESDVDVTNTCKQIQKKLDETKKNIYKNLTAWQRVQLSRHPNRPYTLEHITTITKGTFLELFGDRNFKDDKAMIGGLGRIDGQSFMLIGQQKGINTKMRQFRNFGMANPEGYRKALRLMKMAEKFNIPVVTFIDTPGAYPGLEAPSPTITQIIGTLRRHISKIFLAIASPCPLSSASKPGYAPGVSIKVTTGILNFSAIFIKRNAFL